MDDPKKSEELKDITQILEDVSSLLTFESPMLHSKAFNLQDSMAALEIMDKKMDCCEVPYQKEEILVLCDSKGVDGNEKREDQTPEQRLIFPRPAPTGLDDEVDTLPWNELTLDDAVYIAMEHLIRLESFLNEGSSIVESTYTCLYAHSSVMADMKDRLEPLSLTEQMQAMMIAATKGTLPQHIVYSSTLMIIQLTDLCRGIILNADIYEEEDFTGSTYSIQVFQDRDDESVVSVGRRVIEMIQKQEESLENQDGTSSLNALRAANLILGFELDMIGVITSMAGLSGLDSIKEELKKSQTIARAAVAKASQISTAMTELRKVKTESINVLIKRTFDSNVNCPLVGNAPLRKIVFREAEESLSLLQKIIRELDQVVCSILLKANTLGRIRHMMRNLSAATTNILTRSLVVLNLYFDEKIFGQYLLPEMIMNHLKQLSGVPDSIFTSTKEVPAFLNRLCKPVYDTLKVLTLNKNRQRSYIDVMLGDWASLREEAYIVDVAYHQESNASLPELQPYFSLYVLCVTIDLMDHYVDLGVELQLHCNEEELGIVFWYRDFLTSSLLSQITTMRQTKMLAKKMEVAEQVKRQQQQTQKQANNKTQKSGKKKGKQKKSSNSGGGNAGSIAMPITNPEDIEDDFDFLLLTLKRNMCRGMVRFFAAVRQAGLVPEKKYEFTTSQRIFEKRFELFSCIQQPPPLSYEDYLSGSDFSKVSQGDLWASTADSFRLSRSIIERLLAQIPLIDPDYSAVKEEELRQLAKVCVGNSIYLQKMIQAVNGKGESMPKIKIDNKTNRQFCMIKIE
ncbi:unnamed protein product [Pseudo-nitzschia multistriata]|uniref:Uncharacterized protein n=1 Tax=Pseudo-nitzschia multistriata TaxID=183589 RepID=A0A448YZM0_9STRA|nr:unnamed protein product [Pseudo-nitzschia multistriata]